LAFAATDRVKIQVEYRKALWICPKCGQEDITDLNVGTPSVYEHNCSKCGQWSNSFKEYNGVASYSQEDYAKVTANDLKTEKDAKVDAWIYDIKHPAPYVEPTIAELESQKTELQNQLTSLQVKIDEKTAH
jgi:predicted RNA-binding Zn-ribbon protein involved in translation (DUF1610 family)